MYKLVNISNPNSIIRTKLSLLRKSSMLVFSFHFLVRYLYTLGWSLYNVYKIPQCNWECCVGVVLFAQNIRVNVTEEIGDQSMENQVQGDDLEV